MQILIGFLLGILIALLAWRAGALSVSGAVAAALTGGIIFGLGGWPWAALLLTFFITSSGLSKLFARRKAALNEKFSKGSQRDWAQVAANGGLGTALVLAASLFPDASWPWACYVGAMAAVNADTWATELGVLSKSRPIQITSGKPVERGTSGAISPLGTLAAWIGAAVVGLVAAAVQPSAPFLITLLAASLGGLAGSFFDSFLGAMFQAIFYCPTCQKETERFPLHTCGSKTIPFRGWKWLTNDRVNFACSLVGALVAWLLWR